MQIVKAEKAEQGGYCRFCGSYQNYPCITDAQEAKCPNGYKRQKVEEEELVGVD